MKIKHWQGYGALDAFKLSKEEIKNEYGEKKTQLRIRVQGNHEWGLERDDAYDIWNWLVKKFDKSVGSFYDYRVEVTYNDYYVELGGLDVETCDYTITYSKR